MPYYLAEVVEGRQLPVAVGGGKFERRASRQPVGIEAPAQRNWLYLNDDRVLLWASDPIVDARLTKIADDGRETLATGGRTALSGLAGRQFGAQDRFDATIATMLRSGRFGDFRPSKRRSRFEIRLGPNKLLWSEPAAPTRNTKIYVDNFNRADNTTLGTSSDGLFSWTELSGTVLAITGNQLTATNIPNGGDGAAVTSADCDTDDVYAQIDLVTLNREAGGEIGSLLFVAANDDLSSGYVLQIFRDAGGTRGLYRASNFALLDSDSTLTTSGTLRIERDGSSILGYVGGVEILSATNSAEGSGAGFRLAAIAGFSDGSSTQDIAWDNFGYGDLHAGGQSVDAGLATEADSALAMAHTKASAVGLNSETDAPLAMGRRKSRAIGITSETDTALAMVHSLSRTLGLTTETDAPQAMAWAKAKALGLTTETDSALGITAGRRYAIGLTTEADAAQAMDVAKAMAIGLVEETDSALALELARPIDVGLATETDAAQAMGWTKAKAIGLAEETDAAQPMSSQNVTNVPMGLATETDSAMGMTARKARAIGLSAEADAAQGMTCRKARALGLPAESDAAIAMSARRSVALGLVTEADSAFAFTHRRARTLGLALEVDIALPFIVPDTAGGPVQHYRARAPQSDFRATAPQSGFRAGAPPSLFRLH